MKIYLIVQTEQTFNQLQKQAAKGGSKKMMVS